MFCAGGEGERGGRTKGGRWWDEVGKVEGVEGGRLGERMKGCVCVCVVGGDEGLVCGEEMWGCCGEEDPCGGEGEGEEEMEIASLRRRRLWGRGVEGGSSIVSPVLWSSGLETLGLWFSASSSDPTSSISSFFRTELESGKRGGCRGTSGDEE